ncbi:MAG: type II toxin-antitoxin system VapC family toxin [Bacteroidota bacterium]
MNIVDSSGWIEYIADDANADFFEPPIVDSENLLVPTICLYEVFKRVLQEFGEERALDAMGIMSLGTVIDLDLQIAIHAAQISNELKLAMADSIILATARAYDATLWTQDEHFKGIDGVNLVKKKSRK